MLKPRIIPCLLIHKGGLVKTERFINPKYVGDPLNAVRIFNEKKVDELVQEKPRNGITYRDLITFVDDRPGHDIRYAIDSSKILRELGWEPKETFETGLRKTVQWFLDNHDWWERVMSGAYRLDRIGVQYDR